jgi:hypothetical protein
MEAKTGAGTGHGSADWSATFDRDACRARLDLGRGDGGRARQAEARATRDRSRGVNAPEASRPGVHRLQVARVDDVLLDHRLQRRRAWHVREVALECLPLPPRPGDAGLQASLNH